MPSVTEVRMTQQGTSLSTEGANDGQLTRKFTGRYLVLTDSPLTSVKTVENHFKRTTSLPWFGRPWKWEGGAGSANKHVESVCKKLDVDYIEKSAGMFNVVATYEPKDPSKPEENPGADGAPTTDPLKWREHISVTYTQISEALYYSEFVNFTSGDFANTPVQGTDRLRPGRFYIPQTSAGVPYDPLPEQEIDITVIRMIKNIPVYDQGMAKWQGTVNSDELVIDKPQYGFRFTASPLLARMKHIGASTQFENGIGFWEREVEVWVNPLGWRGKYPNEGLEATPKKDGFLSPGDDQFTAKADRNSWQMELRKIKDESGYPATAPQKLNAFGGLLWEDEPDVWGNWKKYHEQPFKGFPW